MSNTNSGNLMELNPPFLPLEEHGSDHIIAAAVSGNTTAILSASSSSALTSKDDDDPARKRVPKSKIQKMIQSTAAKVGSTTTTAAAAVSSSSTATSSSTTASSTTVQARVKTCISMSIVMILALVCMESLFRSPEDRWIRPDSIQNFLAWERDHPRGGVFAFLAVFAICVIFMLPVGTPLTMGCGFVYKGAYGWMVGVSVATIISMGGSALGAVVCFLLGRYLMREQVRNWIRNYPFFQAIDMAAAEHGFKILAMLYLTPIAPLGPLSYMCGTTSISLSSFLLAKIASLPIMVLYVFIGASAGALIGKSPDDNGEPNASAVDAAEEQARQLEENPFLIVMGIVMSVAMLSTISMYIKRELKLILERPKKEEGKGEGSEDVSKLEMGVKGDINLPRQRHRHHSTDSFGESQRK